MLQLDPDRVPSASKHVCDQCHRPQIARLLPGSIEEDGQHFVARRVLVAGPAREHRHLTVEVQTDAVRVELPVLLQHLLGEGEGCIQQIVEVVLGLLGR